MIMELSQTIKGEGRGKTEGWRMEDGGWRMDF